MLILPVDALAFLSTCMHSYLLLQVQVSNARPTQQDANTAGELARA
jgi:hypothetical protein